LIERNYQKKILEQQKLIEQQRLLEQQQQQEQVQRNLSGESQDEEADSTSSDQEQ
jgi:hypothetical protein